MQPPELGSWLYCILWYLQPEYYSFCTSTVCMNASIAFGWIVNAAFVHFVFPTSGKQVLRLYYGCCLFLNRTARFTDKKFGAGLQLAVLGLKIVQWFSGFTFSVSSTSIQEVWKYTTLLWIEIQPKQYVYGLSNNLDCSNWASDVSTLLVEVGWKFSGGLWLGKPHKSQFSKNELRGCYISIGDRILVGAMPTAKKFIQHWAQWRPGVLKYEPDLEYSRVAI